VDILRVVLSYGFGSLVVGQGCLRPCGRCRNNAYVLLPFIDCIRELFLYSQGVLHGHGVWCLLVCSADAFPAICLQRGFYWFACKTGLLCNGDTVVRVGSGTAPYKQYAALLHVLLLLGSRWRRVLCERTGVISVRYLCHYSSGPPSDCGRHLSALFLRRLPSRLNNSFLALQATMVIFAAFQWFCSRFKTCACRRTFGWMGRRAVYARRHWRALPSPTSCLCRTGVVLPFGSTAYRWRCCPSTAPLRFRHVGY
jgi:hypothetical protein